METCFIELWEIRSHDSVEGLETISSSMPGGKGIEGVSPLRKRFTVVIGFIETNETDCGQDKNVRTRERERGRGRRRVVQGRREREREKKNKGGEKGKRRERGEKKHLAPGWISSFQRSEGLRYLGNGAVSNMVQRLKHILHLWEKAEVLPRLRSSASMFFSPGMWCTLRSVLQRSCGIDTKWFALFSCAMMMMQS